jgi:hypothetical protein
MIIWPPNYERLPIPALREDDDDGSGKGVKHLDGRECGAVDGLRIGRGN